MTLNPKIKLFLENYNMLPSPNWNSITPQEWRNRIKQGVNPKVIIKVDKVENRILPLYGRDIPIRIYTPSGDKPLPVLIYFHGGGMVTGDLEMSDSICRTIAKHAHCAVISVDYRLAPENKFPAAVEDAYDSLLWISSHAKEFNIDPTRIAVGGDSAGGTLATVASIVANERKNPNIIYQLLLYPSTGYEREVPSLQENGKGYFLTTEQSIWYQKQYLSSKEEKEHPYVSPIFYSKMAELPDAMIVTAQYDPLRDIGKAYAERLQESGVAVFYKNYEGMIHGFANFHTFVPEVQIALEECSAQLRKVFGM